MRRSLLSLQQALACESINRRLRAAVSFGALLACPHSVACSQPSRCSVCASNENDSVDPRWTLFNGFNGVDPDMDPNDLGMGNLNPIWDESGRRVNNYFMTLRPGYLTWDASSQSMYWMPISRSQWQSELHDVSTSDYKTETKSLTGELCQEPVSTSKSRGSQKHFMPSLRTLSALSQLIRKQLNESVSAGTIIFGEMTRADYRRLICQPTTSDDPTSYDYDLWDDEFNYVFVASVSRTDHTDRIKVHSVDSTRVRLI